MLAALFHRRGLSEDVIERMPDRSTGHRKLVDLSERHANGQYAVQRGWHFSVRCSRQGQLGRSGKEADVQRDGWRYWGGPS